MSCLICGENEGIFDSGEPCWGCNFTYCKNCNQPIPYDTKCVKCGLLSKKYNNMVGNNEIINKCSSQIEDKS